MVSFLTGMGGGGPQSPRFVSRLTGGCTPPLFDPCIHPEDENVLITVGPGSLLI